MCLRKNQKFSYHEESKTHGQSKIFSKKGKGLRSFQNISSKIDKNNGAWNLRLNVAVMLPSVNTSSPGKITKSEQV